MTSYPQKIELQMQELYKYLPERSRRLYAGVEASKLGHGGIVYISTLFSCSPNTILRGIDELLEKDRLNSERNRKKGGGRKSFVEKNPEANEAFLLILKEHTAGSPMNENVKWTDLTHEEIKGYLLEKGFSISVKTVKKLLKNNGYVKRKALKKKPLVSL
jgi:hypothetical protein